MDTHSMITDTVACSVSLFLIVGYHLFLRLQLHHNPSYSIQAINATARKAWVESIMTGGPGKDVLAVQTLRNSTMAATFFASTAILLIMGVLNLLPRNGEIPTTVFETLHRHAVNGDVGTVKLLLLLAEFFWAFFCFSLAVRMYNHVGFLINSTSGGVRLLSPTFVARMLNRGGRYYSLGMRAYCFSLPVLFWLFGPIYMIAAAIGVVALLYHSDRAPDVESVDGSMETMLSSEEGSS
jgi:uncharacterized membrane protein